MSELTVDELYAVFSLAKKNGEDVIAENEIKRVIGDPDAYSRGIVLTEKNTAETIINIQKLSQTFPWINFIKQNKNLYITLENETNKHWILLSALHAIVTTLMDNGVDCYVDVRYHG